MSHIVDRRKNDKGKSTGNRQKFLKRVEGQIRKAIPDIMSQESIKDSNTGGSVKVPVRGLDEPSFQHDSKTGKKQIVRPGNDRFSEGDRIPKPKGGGGAGGGKGSNNPEVTEDEFTVVLSREEFLKYFFDDLALPNMAKKLMDSSENFEMKRAGYTKDSVPSRLNVKSSYQQSLGRRLALKSVLDKKLLNLQELLAASTPNPEERAALEQEIEKVRRQASTIPFFEDIDLRYNNFERVTIPVTSAVMFCIMDVSGSMGYHEKDIAKRFFTLLYIFLTRQYANVELVFIRHHTAAREVSEDEFFNSRESGGTIVAPSLELMDKIMRERYDERWNVYCCQASDGDVWSKQDALACKKLLQEAILPAIQYMAYIEINNKNSESDLWQAYKSISNDEDFSIRHIDEVSKIWSVFQGLFKKRKHVVES